MQKRKLGKTNLEITSIGLGTWVFGGWPWRDSGEKESEAAIEAAIEAGINLIDTAPIYGFGRAEEIVGKTLKRLAIRDRIVLATKQGFSWDEGKRKKVWKDCSKKAILKEIEASLRRLQTDRIDIYQIHWPDENTPFGKTMEVLLKLKEEEKIGVIGVSNFNAAQLQECLKYAPVESLQPPYNYFRRESEKEILPFCQERGIGVLSYGTLCKGLLTGKFSASEPPKDPVRQESWDPIFAPAAFAERLQEIEELKEKARAEHLTLAQWAIRWVLENPAVTCALVGARNPEQIRENFSDMSLRA